MLEAALSTSPVVTRLLVGTLVRPQKHVSRVTPCRRNMAARALCITISHDRGDESFADDLNMGRGIVSGRVALLLRSTEIPPHRPNDLLPLPNTLSIPSCSPYHPPPSNTCTLLSSLPSNPPHHPPNLSSHRDTCALLSGQFTRERGHWRRKEGTKKGRKAGRKERRREEGRNEGEKKEERKAKGEIAPRQGSGRQSELNLGVGAVGLFTRDAGLLSGAVGLFSRGGTI